MNKNAQSLAGEFAVLSQLALREMDANMTLGYTKNVDILVSNPKTGRMYKLEVKTSRNKPTRTRLFGNTLDWQMSKKHENIMDRDLFYCFVNISGEGNVFRFFVVPSTVVARYVKEQHQYYLKDKSSRKDTDRREFRLLITNEPNIFPSEQLNKWENNWDFDIKSNAKNL
ncbi:MAG: hypothetical protein Q8R55_00805 [Candidatus Taylorbacteria bacterium]|nr:hypothetical protein [Candidatus Taylorbacteria bacterium]